MKLLWALEIWLLTTVAAWGQFFPGQIPAGTVMGNMTAGADIPRPSATITLATTPTYNLASNVVGSSLNIPLDAASHTVAAGKEFIHVLIGNGGAAVAGNANNVFTIGAGAQAVGYSVAMESAAGSDVSSNMYTGSFVAFNDGPGTVKSIHTTAQGSGTSTGGLFGINSEIIPVATTNNLSAIAFFGVLNSNGISPGASVGLGLQSFNGDLFQYGILGGTATALPVNLSFLTWWAANTSGGSARFLQLLNAAAAEIFYVDKTGKLSSAAGIFSTSATAGIGYQTGAGGAVTQVGNKGAAVTLNKITGQITTNNAALNANTGIVFTVNNSAVSATDTVVASLQNGNAVTGTNTYVVTVDTITNNAFNIRILNSTAAPQSDALVINFAVIKGANS